MPLFDEHASVRIAVRLLYTPATVEGIAGELGCGLDAVRAAYHRWTEGAERDEARRWKVAAARRGALLAAHDWAGVNWSKTDELIARELGCHREAVSKMRKRLGKPPSPFRGRKCTTLRALGADKGHRVLTERSIVRRLLETDATEQQIANERGCSRATVQEIYRRHTTPEQRREAKRRKMRKVASEHPAGAILRKIARRVRAEVGAVKVARARHCEGCGVDLSPGAERCAKCGSCSVAEFDRIEAPQAAGARPRSAVAKARANVAAFVESLNEVA